MLEVLDRARLVVVTGKGGTGKTTVAAGLAVAAAGRGRRVLAVEVEGRQGLAGLFGRGALDHREARVADGVSALAVDPDESLREYLERYGFGPLARLLSWSHLNRFITAAAPGLGDVLLVGKVWEATTREGPGRRPAYDLVVLDAPPTGRVVSFLRAPETVAELARVGPIRSQADRVRDLLDDPGRTAVVLTCLPEELPVTETLEGIDALRRAGLPVGGVVANRVTGDRLGGRAGRLAALARDPAPLRKAAAAAGAELDEAALATLVGEARDRQRLVARERRLLKELRGGLDGLPLVELPFLAGGVGGPEEVRALAAHLPAGPGDARPAARPRRAAGATRG
ncbi:MAG TPA: ArsA-related P-loop ATPase [Actinomycetota bacterium]|jgi:anion-transporting  ArsA/GET3 family ATPase|nr:ArsA-related P-loop ATPase [Actinomycetota bacterium]